MRLYSVPTANGQRAAIALEEAALAYEVHKVDIVAGEQRGDEMLAINPFGRVPVLDTSSAAGAPRYLYGSLAIGQFAAQQSGLMIPLANRVADMHQWIGIVMTDLVPAFAAQFYLGELAPERDEWALDWYAGIIDRFMSGIDAHLAGSKYFVGASYTLADVMFYPTAVTSAARLDGGLGRWPAVRRWADTVGQRDAVVRGMAACPGAL